MLIFISYRSGDRALVETLANDLEGLGHNIWFDQELTGGHVWWNSILNTVRDCDLFIFALSPQSLDSYPCQLEYNYADALGKRILPVLLKDINTHLLPPALSKLQFVDYRVQDKKASIGLARALGALPPAAPLPDLMPTAPEAPISGLGRMKERVESNARLSMDEQAALVLELKGFYQKTDTQLTARELFERFRNRPDLFASIDREIDSVLGVDKPINQLSKPVPAAEKPVHTRRTTSKVNTGVRSWLWQFAWAYCGALIAFVPVMGMTPPASNVGPHFAYALIFSVGLMLAKILPGWLNQYLPQRIRASRLVLTLVISGIFAESMTLYFSTSYIALNADPLAFYIAPILMIMGFVIGSTGWVSRITTRIWVGAAGVLGCYLWLFATNLNRWAFPLTPSDIDSTTRDMTRFLYEAYPFAAWCWYIAVALACSLLVYWPEIAQGREQSVES